MDVPENPGKIRGNPGKLLRGPGEIVRKSREELGASWANPLELQRSTDLQRSRLKRPGEKIREPRAAVEMKTRELLGHPESDLTPLRGVLSSRRLEASWNVLGASYRVLKAS